MHTHFTSILATLAALTQFSSAAAVVKRAPYKFMIVGDSISQGAEGDFTWRFRLWQWTQNNGISVDFVGPYKGTNPPADGTPDPPNGEPRTYGGYAYGPLPFDSDHFAVWGRNTAQDKDQIAAHVKTYMPDHLLIELGFNDLGWFVSGPEGTLASMKTLVDNARAVKPDIKFAIANVPQRSHLGGRDDLPIITDQYNALLVAAIPQWSTATSPIKLVKFREEYSCEPESCPAGYDGLHPNALGEYEIARAFSITLRPDYAPNGSTLTVPATMPVRPCTVPANVRATSAGSKNTVTWDKVYGAYSYDILKKVGTGAWDNGETLSSAITWPSAQVTPGTTYYYQIRAGCGGDLKSGWSNVASVVAKA